MHESVNKLISIQEEINRKNSKTKIIAVSKTFPLSRIMPLIDYGHIHFGENKVQESIEKWAEFKIVNRKIKLHMIGKLQSNKVKQAVDLFDYIHSVDNLKLAEKISNETLKKDKNIKIFIQVNIGNETQKSGVKTENLKDFFNECKNNLNLDIIGLMCIPPVNQSSEQFFKKMNFLSNELDLNELSMGMSQDYLNATLNNASFVRIGSKIFGQRS
tara:strand:- start:4848 stop:5492 length:645 start_codon:yes stop_codon:yes gene_type:complete